MAAFAALDLDAQRLALIALGHGRDGAGHGGGEQQRAALGGRRLEDEFEVFAKAEVEHLVGLVEHHGAQLRDVEPAALDMVAQPAGRSDDDVRARLQAAPLGFRVHAADAGDDAGARRAVEPFEFALHLEREFAGGRHDERERFGRVAEPFRLAEQRSRRSQARTRPSCRNRSAPRPGDRDLARLLLEHRRLDRRRVVVVLLGECAGEGRMGRRERHEEFRSWKSGRRSAAGSRRITSAFVKIPAGDIGAARVRARFYSSRAMPHIFHNWSWTSTWLKSPIHLPTVRKSPPKPGRRF